MLRVVAVSACLVFWLAGAHALVDLSGSSLLKWRTEKGVVVVVVVVVAVGFVVVDVVVVVAVV